MCATSKGGYNQPFATLSWTTLDTGNNAVRIDCRQGMIGHDIEPTKVSSAL